MTLGGVIYLLSIADKRMKGTTRRNLDMFHQLCGNKAFARVVLGTTNWGEVEEDVGLNREQQLAETFSKPMTTSGSKFLRFDKTERSAQAFVDAILNELDRKIPVPKQRASWKNKTGDNFMVDGRPTDIVIPCDSIHQLFYLITYQLQCYGPNRSWKKHRMLLMI